MQHVFYAQNEYEMYCVNCRATFGSWESGEYPTQSEVESNCVGIVAGSINHPCTGDGRCECNGAGCPTIVEEPCASID